MEFAIEINNLTKKYKKFKAVDNLTIEIPKGKIYGFLGKNGAGKTTTISMIMGLLKPDEGEIFIFGKDAMKNRVWASKNIGAIIENPAFYENLTAYGNLEITGVMHGTDKKRISEVLNIVQLNQVKNKIVKEFSLGMKQRLGIANALLHDPKILILDEPTNGLDPSGIKEMRNFLKDLSEKNGITILISSHILSEIQQIADYVGIIDKGRLIEEIDMGLSGVEKQSHLTLEVDKIKDALLVLESMEVKYSLEENIIKVNCNKELNSIINKNLIMAGINVYNLASKVNSLEERFISLVS